MLLTSIPLEGVRARDLLETQWTRVGPAAGLRVAGLEGLRWDTCLAIRPVSLEDREVKREGANVKVGAVRLAVSEMKELFLCIYVCFLFHTLANVCLFSSLEVNDYKVQSRWYIEVTHHRVMSVSEQMSFFSTFPCCQGVPSSQMDAVKQRNDACFPSWALAIAAVYMQSNSQTSCNTHRHAHTHTLFMFECCVITQTLRF